MSSSPLFPNYLRKYKNNTNDGNEMLVLVHSVGLGIDWGFRSSPSGVGIKRHTFRDNSALQFLLFTTKAFRVVILKAISTLLQTDHRSWSSVCSSLTAEWYYFVFYFPSCPKTIFFFMTSSTQLLLTSENFYVFFFKLKLNIVEITWNQLRREGCFVFFYVASYLVYSLRLKLVNGG